MIIRENQAPAVILKSVAHGGLGAVRSLGRAGIDTYTVEAGPWTPAIYSRYNRSSLRLDIETTSAEIALFQLEALAKRIGRRSVLIPSTDYAAIFIADHAAILRRWFNFSQQPPQLLRALYSKREMYFVARQHGVATPETVFPTSRQEVIDYVSSARFPLVLKGIDGTRLNARRGKKMVIADCAEEVIAAYDELEDTANPNLMLQEYIATENGATWMFNGYFNDESQPLVAFTGKKLRQCPAFGGYTCFGICSPNELVQRTATEFLKALGYSGLVDIDFCYDSRDGRYKILDVNPRLGATFRLFTATNGMDLVRAYYLDMTGQPVPYSTTSPERKWIVGDLDFVSSIRYCRRSQMTLWEWMNSLRGIQETAYFAWDDPLPFAARLLADGFEMGRRVVRSIRTSLSRKTAPRPNTCRERMPAGSEVEIA